MSELNKGTRYIKKAFHIVRRRFTPGAVILFYHRVAQLPTDPYSMAVSPDRFAQHMEYIHRTCSLVRLRDLTDAMRLRELPHRAVAVTFDDGYADNYWQAYPLLKSTEIPVTIFITSNKVDSVREYWWDDLERMLSLPIRPPEHLRMTVRDQEYEWQLGSAEQQQRARKEIFSLLRPLDADAREESLGKLASWAGLEREGRPDYRAVTASQLIDLARAEYIDIGAHTKTHPMLSALPADAQRAEVLGSRHELESIIQRRIHAFAYPYGTAQDFTDETVQIVREAGFDLACTTIPGSVESGDDPFRLSRCVVYDWEIDYFKRRLESYFVHRG